MWNQIQICLSSQIQMKMFQSLDQMYSQGQGGGQADASSTKMKTVEIQNLNKKIIIEGANDYVSFLASVGFKFKLTVHDVYI